MEDNTKCNWDLSSFALHMTAMALMLCDHLWATVIPGNDWLTWLGRLAFPIFAFLTVEGYCHTRNVKKYMQRLLIFALLSEIPFNLMYSASVLYPFQQNVLWTFLWSLLCLRAIDKVRHKYTTVPGWLLTALVTGAYMLAATVTFVDYFGYGVLTVVVFYLFRGSSWDKRLCQFIGLYLINWQLMSGMSVPVTLFGTVFEIPLQGAAIFALLPIWCYRGRQGLHSKATQYFNYAFYPVHMLILGLLSL